MNDAQIKRQCQELEQGLKDTGLRGEALVAIAMAVAANLARDAGMTKVQAADSFERCLAKMPEPKGAPGLIEHPDIKH